MATKEKWVLENMLRSKVKCRVLWSDHRIVTVLHSEHQETGSQINKDERWKKMAEQINVNWILLLRKSISCSANDFIRHGLYLMRRIVILHSNCCLETMSCDEQKTKYAFVAIIDKNGNFEQKLWLKMTVNRNENHYWSEYLL